MKLRATVISFLIFAETAGAQTNPPSLSPATTLTSDSELKITDGFWKNVGDTFKGSNLLLHAAGFASTYAIVGSGLDAQVHDEFKDHPSGISTPGAFIGAGILTAGLATTLYFKGKSQETQEDRKTLGAAYMIAQATAIQFTYVHTLKALTGRPNADNDSSVPIREQSENFRFGILRGGIFYGWPSGHVSHTVAITSALAYYYPEKPWIGWAGAGLSAYMIYAVSAADHGQMHWFSEGIAGAFMGYAIGSTLGKNWRARVEGLNEPEEPKVAWFPYAAPGLVGANVVYRF